ncbi:MAG: hypothetical protein CVU97_04905 [Firmicutes bacterium HGW-Firmicutes-21]|nr:MAG: hypothetical protein CVU97_04905 [Firmicutes bacterium HGW-Firmicutes-21]
MKKFNTRGLVFLAMMAAISVVLGVYKIPIGDSLRITFMNIPIILASLWFGPFAGMAVGLSADFIAANLTTGWYPPLALTPVLFGLLPWLLKHIFLKKQSFAGFLAVVLMTNIAGTMLWSTYALTLLLGLNYFTLLTVRVPLYLGIALVETVCIYYLSKSGLDRIILSNRPKWWLR